MAVVQSQLRSLELKLAASEAAIAAAERDTAQTVDEVRAAVANWQQARAARPSKREEAMRDEVKQLRDKEKQLRDKEKQLRDEEKQLRDERRLRLAPGAGAACRGTRCPARPARCTRRAHPTRAIRCPPQATVTPAPLRCVSPIAATRVAEPKLPAPSSFCDQRVWAQLQAPKGGGLPLFYCFRPLVGPPDALPAALVSPVFGAFSDAAEVPLASLGGCEAESRVLENLLWFMPAPLGSEAKRQGLLNTALARFLDCDIAPRRLDDESTAAADGIAMHTVPGACDVPLLIVEVKNEMGAPSGDPYFQLQREYQMLWSEQERAEALPASARPALLLEVVGPCLRVSAAASLEPGRVLCEPLTPFLHFLHLRDQPRYMARLVATLRALRAAVASLRDYYQAAGAVRAVARGSVTAPQAQRALPYPLRDDGGGGRFTAAALLYQDRLLWSVTERRRGDGSDDAPVCVKFSRHEYGAAVHAAWAAAGLAPALYECSVLPGGLRMVIMEHLCPQEGWCMLFEVSAGAERDAAKAAALAALAAAHAVPLPGGGRGGHGDCPPANTRVRAAPASPGGWEVRFIDFDGAGA